MLKPSPQDDPRGRKPTITRTEKVLCWRPLVSLRHALCLTVSVPDSLPKGIAGVWYSCSLTNLQSVEFQSDWYVILRYEVIHTLHMAKYKYGEVTRGVFAKYEKQSERLSEDTRKGELLETLREFLNVRLRYFGFHPHWLWNVFVLCTVCTFLHGEASPESYSDLLSFSWSRKYFLHLKIIATVVTQLQDFLCSSTITISSNRVCNDSYSVH